MTRTMTIAAAVLLCAGVLPVARANCGPAPRPAFAIPDGAHASRDEMSTARDNLSEYSAQVAAYATCLDAEQADSGPSAGTDAQRLRDRYLVLGSAALRQLASVVSVSHDRSQSSTRPAAATMPVRRSAPATPSHRRNRCYLLKEYPCGPRAGNSTLRPRPYTTRRKLKGGKSWHIVLVQMIVTAVLLVGFTVEVLLGKV